MSIDRSYVHDMPAQRPGRFARYLSRFEEGNVIRWAFIGMLTGTLCVLAIDLNELAGRNGGLWPQQFSETAVTVPVLPPAVEADNAGGGRDPREFLTTDETLLRDPIRFSLETGGVLKATGSIDQGAAQRFAAEVEARGEYISTVALDSPGGSLDDAMTIARLVRAKGFATMVSEGALCASSCPIILAGGTERSVDARAAVGLHQFYAAGVGDLGPHQAMADAQMTTARIARLLAELGVDATLWLHALDTPPRSLYYLSQEEMARYRLITSEPKLALRGAAGIATVIERR